MRSAQVLFMRFLCTDHFFSSFMAARRCTDRTAKEVAIFSFCTRILGGTSKWVGAKFQIA